MKKFTLIFLALIGFGYGFFNCTANAQAADPNLIACGGGTECPSGYVCEGERGNDAASTISGYCTPNVITVVWCRVVHYFTDEIGKVFMLFSVTMVGIAFFLGKISWGMIMTVILGSGFVMGAGKLVLELADNDGIFICDSINSIKCYAGEYKDGGDGVKNTYNVLNSSKVTSLFSENGDLCDLLGCKVIVCSTDIEKLVSDPPAGTVNSTTKNYSCLLREPSETSIAKINGSDVTIYKYRSKARYYVPRSTTIDNSVLWPQLRKNYIEDGETGCNTLFTGTAKALVNATIPVCYEELWTTSMDYFRCTNACTKEDYVIRHKANFATDCFDALKKSTSQSVTEI